MLEVSFNSYAGFMQLSWLPRNLVSIAVLGSLLLQNIAIFREQSLIDTIAL